MADANLRHVSRELNREPPQECLRVRLDDTCHDLSPDRHDHAHSLPCDGSRRGWDVDSSEVSRPEKRHQQQLSESKCSPWMLQLKSKSFLPLSFEPSPPFYANPKGEVLRLPPRTLPHTSSMAAKRERVDSISNATDEPKPKRKSSKKHATPAPVPSKESECFEAAAAGMANVRPPPPIPQTPIKIEKQDEKKTSKSDKTTGKEKEKEKAKAAVQYAATTAKPKTTPLRVDVAPVPASATVNATPTAATKSAKDVESKRISQPARSSAVIDIGSSEYDEDEDDDDDSDDSDDASTDSDDEGSDHSGDEEQEEQEKGNIKQETTGSSDEQCEIPTFPTAVVAADSSKVAPDASSDLCNKEKTISSALRGCFDEADHYLRLLIHVRLTSEAILPALREMIFHWLDCGFDIDAIRGAFQEPQIVKQLQERGATSMRLQDLSELLQEADLVEHFASWLKRKMPDVKIRRQVCALLVPPQPDHCKGSSESIAPSKSAPRTETPLSTKPGPNVHPERIGNVGADHMSHPPARHPGRDSYRPGDTGSSRSGPSRSGSSRSGSNFDARAGTTEPQRSFKHGRADDRRTRSHNNGRSPVHSVPYVKIGDAPKVLLFIVGTPYTALTNSDFNAHDFRSACNYAFGASNVKSVSICSKNVWKVTFNDLAPDSFRAAVFYQHCTLYPQEAVSPAPDTFFSDCSGIEMADTATFESIAGVFGTRAGSVHRLEQGNKRYIIVHFKYAPDFLRFYARLPFKNASGFMPAFLPCHQGGRTCSLCRVRHHEAVCPAATPLYSSTVSPR